MKDKVVFRPGTILCGSCDFFGAEDCYYESLEPTADKWACSHHPYIRQTLSLSMAWIRERIEKKRSFYQNTLKDNKKDARVVASVGFSNKKVRMLKKW